MIRIELSERRDGADMATHGDTVAEHPKASAVHLLARKLVQAGAPDQPWEAYRSGALCLRGRSLHELAAVDKRDADAGIKTTLWQPFPGDAEGEALHAALKHARARLSERAPAASRRRPVSADGRDAKPAGARQEAPQ